MYAVIQKDSSLPTVISQNSSDFPTYIMSGYEVIYQGDKNACNAIYDEMIVEFANEID